MPSDDQAVRGRHGDQEERATAAGRRPRGDQRDAQRDGERSAGAPRRRASGAAATIEACSDLPRLVRWNSPSGRNISTTAMTM